jgi:hypothetical protein
MVQLHSRRSTYTNRSSMPALSNLCVWLSRPEDNGHAWLLFRPRASYCMYPHYPHRRLQPFSFLHSVRFLATVGSVAIVCAQSAVPTPVAQLSAPAQRFEQNKNLAVGRYSVTWYQAEGDDAPVRFCSCKLVSHTTVTDAYRKALLCRPVQVLRRLC